MKPIDDIRALIPDFAKDVRLNLGTLLGADGSPDLTADQKWGAALAAAIAARNPLLTQAIEDAAAFTIEETVADAARTAAAIMGITNIYYRALHMAGNMELSARPAGLRMNGLTQHGVDHGDFELFGLAASVINGCEGCTKAHVNGALRLDVSVAAVQAVLRIAAVIHAAAAVLDVPDDSTPLRRPSSRSHRPQPQAIESAN
jgi:alkyl hydroperoxide reductase subunit D